jgi:hypothetical protein
MFTRGLSVANRVHLGYLDGPADAHEQPLSSPALGLDEELMRERGG